MLVGCCHQHHQRSPVNKKCTRIYVSGGGETENPHSWSFHLNGFRPIKISTSFIYVRSIQCKLLYQPPHVSVASVFVADGLRLVVKCIHKLYGVGLIWMCKQGNWVWSMRSISQLASNLHRSETARPNGNRQCRMEIRCVVLGFTPNEFELVRWGGSVSRLDNDLRWCPPVESVRLTCVAQRDCAKNELITLKVYGQFGCNFAIGIICGMVNFRLRFIVYVCVILSTTHYNSLLSAHGGPLKIVWFAEGIVNCPTTKKTHNVLRKRH